MNVDVCEMCRPDTYVFLRPDTYVFLYVFLLTPQLPLK